jgi:hypothetical protein
MNVEMEIDRLARWIDREAAARNVSHGTVIREVLLRLEGEVADEEAGTDRRSNRSRVRPVGGVPK